jgi:hypothetical protein
MARSLDLRLTPLAEPWAQRGLLIGLRDLNAIPQPVRLLINHLG